MTLISLPRPNALSHRARVSAWRFSWSAFALLSLIIAAGAMTTPAQAQEQFTAQSNHPPVAIPDDDAQFAIESSIFVPADLIIGDVNVTVNIQHPAISDLEVDLFAPNGERVRLADEVCPAAANFEGTIFDDDSAVEIGGTCPPGAASYRPDDDLDEFDGSFSGGVWTLVVKDTEDDNVGSLIGWSLAINGAFASGPTFSSNSVVSGASFLGGAVAPGEIAAIFGTALGPAQGESAQIDQATQSLPTELAGVRVSFDGVPAPLFYVSSSQLNVQVPFEVAGKEETTIRVDFSDTGNASLTVPVLMSGPAIFTLNGRGQGRAVALNPNGSVNDVNNPAAPGATVSLFATGLGPVEPDSPTGRLAPASPLAEVEAEVTAMVGQSPAQVSFAGLAPGYVGLYQVNVIVPSDTQAGQIIPIALSIGDRGVENLTWITVR
ncbi:MAG: proprotein convertase P-domain-containing protein [Bryobacterales bacterium]